MVDFLDVIRYYGRRNNEFDFFFNFGLLGLDDIKIVEDVY